MNTIPAKSRSTAGLNACFQATSTVLEMATEPVRRVLPLTVVIEYLKVPPQPGRSVLRLGR